MRISKLTSASIGALAVSLALGAGSPVLAQDTTDENEAAAEGQTASNRIVVTARKRDEDLTDIPVPVSIATAEQLERDQIYTLTDLARVAPALEVSSTFGGEANGGAGIRGIRTGVFNASVAPSVAFVIDQAAQGNLAFPILFDLAQVEVLRGPQGTLFGQGASAGVLNISSVAPSFDRFSVSGSVDLSDDGTAGSESSELVVRAAINMPISDIAAVRIAGHFKREEGLQTNRFLDQDNQIDEFAVRGRIRLEPSYALRIDLIGEHAELDRQGVTFFAPVTIPNNPAPFGPPGATLGGISTGNLTDPNGCGLTTEDFNGRARFYCTDQMPVNNRVASNFTGIIEYEASDSVSLTSVTSYRATGLETVVRNFSGRVGGPAARDENLNEETTQFSQELRVAVVGNGFDVIAGGFYNDFSSERTPLDPSRPFGATGPDERSGFSVCAFSGAFCPVAVQFPNFQVDNQTIALFADATVDLSDQLELFGGLRWTNYENTTMAAINDTQFQRTGSIDEDNLSGRIGLSYRPNPDTNIYASYSRGYKPGANAEGALPTDPLVNLASEESSSFEFGVKVDVADLQLAGNVFYMDVSNFQAQESIFLGGELVSRALNIANVESYGFELSALGQLTDNLSINAGYQFNQATYPGGFAGDDGISLAGQQVQFAPRHKFTLSGEYVQPVSNSLEGFLNANLIYKSEIRLSNRTAQPNSNHLFILPANETVNLRAGIRDVDGAWTLSVFVRNLTRNRDYASILPITFAGQDDWGVRGLPVAGKSTRLVGVSFGFEF